MPYSSKNTLCLFACHFKNDNIPTYLKLYLSELRKYCSTLVLINENDAFLSNDSDYLEAEQIQPLILPNLGHDFGSWMRGLAEIDIENYAYFLFANDSCILTQPLKPFFRWLKSSESDFAGLINSNERGFHVQSFFIATNQIGLSVIKAKFKKHGFITDKKKLIKNYEVGISQAQLSKKNSVQTFLHIPESNKNNPMFHQTRELIQSGFPLVKKQLVFNELSEKDIIALSSAGIYTGPQVIKDSIVSSSRFKDENWADLFKDQPIRS